MSPEPRPESPSADLPSLSVRWQGLVIGIDANTLNTLVRHATRSVAEIDSILIEPDEGRLGLTVRAIGWMGLRVTLRSHLTAFRFKEGFLGFRIDDLSAFGFLTIPHRLIRKAVEKQPPGRAFYYPDSRILVLNLNEVIPPELSVQVEDVRFENGEIRVYFGESVYRLDRIMQLFTPVPE